MMTTTVLKAVIACGELGTLSREQFAEVMVWGLGDLSPHEAQEVRRFVRDARRRRRHGTGALFDAMCIGGKDP